MSLQLSLLFLHLLAVVVWVGGTFCAVVCVLPAAGRLEPPLRLPLLHSALGRFFPWAALAVVIVLATGIVMMIHVGFANAPGGWHWMMVSGIAMMLAFGHVYAAGYRRLGRAVATADWPAADNAMKSIRRLLTLILALGVLAIAFATLGSGFK